MCLIVLANLNDLIVNSRCRCTLCQQMLSADPFDGLTHHRCGTQIHQLVAQLTDCRIACDAGGRIRSAALDAQHKLGNVTELLLLHGCLCRHPAGCPHCLLNGLQRAALFLNAEGHHRLTGFCLDLLPKLCVGHCLTAQTDDHNAVDIGIAGKACQNPLRHLRVCCHIRASRVEYDVYGTAHLTGHDPAALTAAGTGRQNQYMIADSRTAFFTLISPELHLLFLLTPVPFHCHNPAEC